MENNQNTFNDDLHPGLDTFTLYDSEAMSLTDLLAYMLGDTAGITIDPTSLNYIGAESATSYFETLAFGDGVGLSNSGILLTSGDGAPARTNTQESYSVNHSGGEWNDDGYLDGVSTGDQQLTEIAQTAFPGAGTTYDAAILEFAFTVTDSSIRSISLDLMFGSEEYPVYIDSSYVDIAAVIVNGQNYAYIDGDEQKPLSIVGATTEDGRFIDNTVAYDEVGASPLSIEYNGITPKLTVSIPLQEDEDTYQVRIGIADTGDAVLDSGLFVSNFQSLTSNYEGTLVNVEADDQGSTLVSPAPDTATKFLGGVGNDIMMGSTAPDVYDLQKGGSNTIKGNMANLNKDTVVGFSEQDKLSVEDSVFTTDQMIVTMGSAILDIDSDGDGEIDGTVTFEGDYRKGVFIAESNSDGTDVSFKALDITPDHAQWVPAVENELVVNQAGMTKLLGDTADKHVTVSEGSSVMNLAAGTNVTLEGVERSDVQLLRDGTTLLVIDQEGNVLVQLASSTSSAYTSTLSLNDGTFELTANGMQQSLALSGIDQADVLLGDFVFENDGDRFMGAAWPDASTDSTNDAVELMGVQPDDASLMF